MSILNVDKIQPVGGGSTITVDATDIQASTGTVRASTFSGDVSATGIGVTSLNVAGVTTFTGAVTSSSAITAHDYRSGGGVGNTLYLTSADDWRFRTTGGNERLRIKSDGKIGLGVNATNPSFQLQIHESVNTAYAANATVAQLAVGNVNSSSATNAAGIHLFTDGNGRGLVNLSALNNSTSSSADFAIQTRHSATIAERLRITSSGSVNIGGDYTQTTYKLKVSGTSYLTGVVRVPNGSAAAPAIHFGDSDSGVYGDASNGVRLTAGGSDTIVATTNGVTFPPKVTTLTSFTLGSQSALSKPLYFADAASVESSSILLDNSSQELRIKNGRFSGQITFTTYNTEKLRIESGGDVKINTGDIYFATAGKGIVLGATSNTDAHTLDHYEEGTTGLTVKCGSVTVPLLNNTCKWTRIGNTLHVSAWIRISGGTNASGISATDPVKITGFPFATVGNGTGRTRLVFTGYSFGNVSNVTWGWMVVGDGATTHEHELHWGNLNFSTITAPDGNNITSGGNYLSSEIYLNGHMFV